MFLISSCVKWKWSWG